MKKNINVFSPLVLVILDGWGIAAPGDGNAISRAKTNNFDKIIADYPVCTLKAAGSTIGLLKNQAGDCEIGHYCLGTSRKWPINITDDINSTLSGCLSKFGYKLSYLSDSEKIAYITHFFNGGSDHAVIEAETVISSSPRVDNYMDAPELVSPGVYKTVKKAIKQKGQNAIIVNFSNLDLVARAGSLKATIKAIEIIDNIIGDLAVQVSDKKGILAIVADHGIAETMVDPVTGEANKNATDSPVPFILVSQEFLGRNIGWQDASGNDLSVLKPIGSLLDFAPTILDLLDIKKPKEMVGKSLLID